MKIIIKTNYPLKKKIDLLKEGGTSRFDTLEVRFGLCMLHRNIYMHNYSTDEGQPTALAHSMAADEQFGRLLLIKSHGIDGLRQGHGVLSCSSGVRRAAFKRPLGHSARCAGAQTTMREEKREKARD